MHNAEQGSSSDEMDSLRRSKNPKSGAVQINE